MIEIDGSYGEGGGQILRTSLALSMLLKKPFRMRNIRAKRDKPGLRPQHKACIEIARLFSDAVVEGDEIGSTELLFVPKKFKSKSIKYDIGTAGSCTLLMQSILLPLMFGTRTVKVAIKGGTDVPFSMPSDYTSNVLLKNLQSIADIRLTIVRRGFYPKGNGEIELTVKPKFPNPGFIEKPLEFIDTGRLMQIKGSVFSSKDMQGKGISERITEILKLQLSKYNVHTDIVTQYNESDSPSLGVVVWAISNNDEVMRYSGADMLYTKDLDQTIPEKTAEEVDHLFNPSEFDEHFCDNIIPLIGVIGGKIRFSRMTEHIRSNIYVTEKFTEKRFEIQENIIQSQQS